jgi:hypothetical protein
MRKTIYINRVSGQHKRKTHKGEDRPPFLHEFDVWLDMKVLNFTDDHPCISFNSQRDFVCPPRPDTIEGKNGLIKGYFITFRESAISDSLQNYEHYMKINTKALIEKLSNALDIFFPVSACYISPKKIYIDGPRPICMDSDLYAVMDYDTWVNMSSLGNIHPWVAFNRNSEVIVSPIDNNLFALTFEPHIISISCDGMDNPVEVHVLNNNIVKNYDESITIIVNKTEYIMMDLSESYDTNGFNLSSFG